MALYKLPQSLGVPPQDNKVPAFGIRIDFAEGAFSEHCFALGNSNALWALVGASVSLEDKVFFEIEREDAALKFQGYGDQREFCLFQDTYQHAINLIGSPKIDSSSLNLVQIWDMRWELTYFLPRASFCDFATMVRLGTQSLQSGSLGEYVTFPQSFPELGLPEGYC